MNNFVSILIIARPFWGSGLKCCLESLKTTTQNTEGVEILIKCDDDSPETLDVANEYKSVLPIKTFIMPGKYRASGVEFYTNSLCAASTGGLVWWWSDEVRMQTLAWEKNLKPYSEKYQNTINLLVSRSNTDSFWFSSHSYPLLTRGWLVATGIFTISSRIDSWNNILWERLHLENIIVPDVTISLEDFKSSFQKELSVLSPKPEEAYIDLHLYSDEMNSLLDEYTIKLKKAKEKE